MSSQVDLHIHTAASDGTDSVREVLEKLMGQGIRTFSVTDHDTIEGAVMMEGLVPAGLRFIRGIEFSCVTPRGKCHILGYGYDPEAPAFREALETGRRLRRDKLMKRLDFLRERFGIVLTAREMDWLMGQKSPGKPHLGQLMVRRGLAPDLDTGIRQYVNPCKTGEDRIGADMAVRAILSAGGIPVWAHPLGGEGKQRLSEQEFADQLETLLSCGIRGLECYYSRYRPADIAFLLGQADAQALLISGGSDYHGANKKNIGLGKLNDMDTPVEPERLTVLCQLPG